ncbi:cyanophycinase [Ningiella sp. W23]|uniref:cyanophycinase n=1 Tax=Ningiella sp. W23 TaxID=3023715 RepID=UPI0037569066
MLPLYLWLAGHAQAAQQKEYQLLLAGGALNTCSSLSQHNCTHSRLNSDSTSPLRQQMLYEISDKRIEALEVLVEKQWIDEGSAELNHVSSVLRNGLQTSLSKAALTRSELFDYFDHMNILDAVKALPDPAYFALLDHLEHQQLDSQGNRLRELADVNQNTNHFSARIYQRFAEQVRLKATRLGQNPHILVATSSSRDAFEVADFYESAFESLGIEATWFPVDQALAYALSNKDLQPDTCENLPSIRARFHLYDRERIYPQRTQFQEKVCKQSEILLKLIERSQGMFFNGGDQSKTLNSLLNNRSLPLTFWKLVQQQVQNNNMIVGGTSAGTAVQAGNVFANRPIPMITNGTSASAVKRGPFPALAPSQRCSSDACDNGLNADDLTYMPRGGSGLFHVGFLDTHFSERDREGRMIALALTSKSALAAGVDETTALLYANDNTTIHLEVLGKNGVFLVDGDNHVQQIVNSPALSQRQMAGFAHFLVDGMRATIPINSLEREAKNQAPIPKLGMLELNESGEQQGFEIVSERKVLSKLEQGVWRDVTRQYCGGTDAISFSLFNASFVLAPDDTTRFFVDRDRKHCGYTYLPFVIDYSSSTSL